MGGFSSEVFLGCMGWFVLAAWRVAGVGEVVGGVIVGDVLSWRVDHMPYGGVKDSGLGREGILFAMEDMTEIRNLVIRQPPS